VFTARDVVDLRRSIRQLAPIVATGERLAFLDEEASAPITGKLKGDAKRLRRLKTIARWASEDPFMLSGTANIGLEALSQLVSAVYEYVNMVLLLDGNAIYFAHRDLAAHGGTLVRVAAAVGEIDAALSVSAWRAERDDWTQPEFGDAGSRITISALRHPLIPDPVPNDVSLTPGRGLLITGSNMSGKSTFLRTVGISIVLAQTIHTCLADTYRVPVIDVQSCIGRADDLVAGKSYYLVEVEQVVNRLRASEGQSSHLFIFDELFRGTNAIERIAAGEAVLRQVLSSGTSPKPHVALAATHDAELVGLLADLYDPWHFTDTVTDEGLTFDYRLQAGPSRTRNAITLLAQQGAPDAVVARALASALAIERQRDTAHA
jgi:DNA mismatch repair ATPase MutS